MKIDRIEMRSDSYYSLGLKFVEISVITPPVGLNLFIMKGVFPSASMGEIIRGCGWFMAMDVLTIIILMAIPSISTFLPSMM